MNTEGAIESKTEFKNTNSDQWKRWNIEFNAANKANSKWHEQANRTVQKYLNDRKNNSTGENFKLNLFHTNIQTIQAMMFGKLPEITFSRTNLDAQDDIARVAGMIFERMLNADIGTPNDQYSESLRQNLEDRLIPGMGISRVRYTFKEEEVEVAAVTDMNGMEVQAATTEMAITEERAPIDYVHWRDFKWSPARTWAEVSWVSFRTLLTRDQLVERFGEEVGNKIPLTHDTIDHEEDSLIQGDDPQLDAYSRAEVWEIWEKDSKKVYWWVKGYQAVLDIKDDPLQLTGFYPIPEPMTTNTTTTAFMPIPDYVMAQDLYLEIDELETRIVRITEAIKVVGCYDASAEGVKRMMSEGVENELIPVDNWAMFAEKGGLQGTIDWMPIEEIANVLNKLVERRNDAENLLNRITGIADIMQGGKQAAGAVSATERALESRFASVKVQALQDEFAKYATDLIRLRAEVIKIHFQPESIVQQSNIMVTTDAQIAPQAIQAIKDDPTLLWRIEVKPESVAMVDYVQLQNERVGAITATATLLQSAGPLLQMSESAVGPVIGMLQWLIAGFKGSQELESIMDQAAAQIQAEQQQPKDENAPPSPEEIKAQAEQAKMQHEKQKMQFEQQKMQMEQQFEKEKWQYEIQVKEMEHRQRMMEIKANSDADLIQEKAQASLNIAENKDETGQIIIREKAKATLAPRPSA